MKFETTPTVRELLDAAAEYYNEKAFIKFIRNDAVIEKSFTQVRKDSLAFCRRIRQFCPTGGEHIVLVGKSSYEYIVSLTGILISGNVAIPVAPDTSAENAVQLFNDADVSYILYGKEFADKVDYVKENCPQVKNVISLGDYEDYERVFSEYDENSEYAKLSDIKVNPQDCALIIYTSGSTGDRKGVMLSTFAICQNLMFKPHSEYVFNDDVLLSVLPMYHIFCFISDYLGPLMHGNTLCLNGEMRDLFKNLLFFKPGTMRVVPMIAQAILARINAVAAKNPDWTPLQAAAAVTGGDLKWLLSGGAYLDPAICLEFEKYGMYLRQGYGMSEAAGKICVPDEDAAVDCVGRIMNFIDVRIQDNEIQFNTPCRMIGYYKKPEETAAAFTEDGWLKTGDMGYFTEDRELFITGRVKNLIILSNGENVSPEGLEKQLKKNLIVSECLIYAEKDRIVADIYPDTSYAELNGITDISAEIEKIVDNMNVNALPSHTIAEINITEEPLPKGPTGKILRK